MNDELHSDPIPDVEEMTTLFIHTLSDIFNMKTYLVSYLPSLSSKATFNPLKTMILNSCIIINGEIIRMNTIFKILHHKRDLVQPSIHEGLDLEEFISRKIEYKSPSQSDYALIIHLTVLAGMQISTFQLLSKLSKRLELTEVNSLINLNLQEAIKTKDELSILADTFLTQLA